MCPQYLQVLDAKKGEKKLRKAVAVQLGKARTLAGVDPRDGPP